MYDTLPTIRIKADTPRGYRIINASAFDASKHSAFDDTTPRPVTPANAAPALSYAKGPRGKWFVHFDGERQSPGYDTEDAARAAMGL
jgi:hypothetical protein